MFHLTLDLLCIVGILFLVQVYSFVAFIISSSIFDNIISNIVYDG